MDVLVTGGDGFVGRNLCDELAERGHDVTALSRDPDPSVFEADVDTAIGDVTAYDSMKEAFAGRDAVFNLVALSALYQPSGGEERHFEVHLGGTENAVRAAEEHGVERFVQMSALGADPQGPTAYIRAKGEAEGVVRDSALDWTIFRPSVVFGDGDEFASFTKMLTTPYVTGLPGADTVRFQPIWIGDFAPMLVDSIEDGGHVGETYEIGGPAVLTLGDVTKLVYRAEGKSVSVIHIPTSLAKVGGTLIGPIPLIPFGPNQARSLEIDNTVADNDATVFGRTPADLRSFADYLGVT
ncbi:complex I NDUFA9 subunit family protein [Halococcus agarilyticus]|uniref:complex I NDUFA9 subunit family protein n=1 Tax=Halococcus agarilyticus TaxID=1232219 RepID=UPI0006782CD7|nr:complex I NDUFA9 subunit family protein [Halococcus agarilyticus]